MHFVLEHGMRFWPPLLARHTSMQGMCVTASDLASIRRVREAAAGDRGEGRCTCESGTLGLGIGVLWFVVFEEKGLLLSVSLKGHMWISPITLKIANI